MEKKNIGILYERHGKKGLFYSGFIEVNGQKQEIVIFKNDRPKSDKSPHMTIYPALPREQGYKGPQASYQPKSTESWTSNEQVPSGPSSKQIGLLFATAQRNGWDRDEVRLAVKDNTGGGVEDLTKDRFQSALKYFTNTKAPKAEAPKVVKNYAPTKDDNFGEVPSWVTEAGPDSDLPF
jgi:hypothetical protein